jgi:Lar family restriction alleviation protein
MKLKPCPFCGGKAEIRKTRVLGYYTIYCLGCAVKMFSYPFKVDVIQKWNNRVREENK